MVSYFTVFFYQTDAILVSIRDRKTLKKISVFTNLCTLVF